MNDRFVMWSSQLDTGIFFIYYRELCRFPWRKPIHFSMQYCCILFASYTIYNQEARTKISDFFFILSEEKTDAFRIHNFISGSIAYNNFEA